MKKIPEYTLSDAKGIKKTVIIVNATDSKKIEKLESLGYSFVNTNEIDCPTMKLAAY